MRKIRAFKSDDLPVMQSIRKRVFQSIGVTSNSARAKLPGLERAAEDGYLAEVLHYHNVGF
jgi:hypothetical protein